MQVSRVARREFCRSWSCVFGEAGEAGNRRPVTDGEQSAMD